MSTHDPPLLGELTTEEFRQKLAGLIDPQEQQDAVRKEELKQAAISFVAILPELFGDELERTTLWDRIGTGLQTAFAKTVGDDYEFFFQQVLEHIKANPGKASMSEGLSQIMLQVGGWSSSDRQAWIAYFGTHPIPILVHARAAWEETKASRKKQRTRKSRNTVNAETLKSFVADTEEEANNE